MTLFGKKVSVFVLIQGCIGIVLTLSGTITAYIATVTNHNTTAAGITGYVLTGFGVVLNVWASFVHKFQPGGPPSPPSPQPAPQPAQPAGV